MRRDYINVAILWFVTTLIAEFSLPWFFRFIFPSVGAEEAAISDESLRMLFILATPVFTFVMSVLAYSLIHFRAKGGDLEYGAPIRGNSGWVWGTWLLITATLNVAVVIHPGLSGLAKFQGNRVPDVVVKVNSVQWAWRVSYPELAIDGVTEVVLPLHKRVKFEVTAAPDDVMHSLWIPAFRHKIDAVPGVVTLLYVTPEKAGSFTEDFNYRIQCAELCGTGHAAMVMPVRVVSQADFDAWIANQAEPTDPVARGARLAKTQGCIACHSLDGSAGVGPSWRGLFGKQELLEDGSTVKVDEAYLLESILNPNAKITKGFKPDIMLKDFGAKLKQDQLDALIAYLKTLK
jgi:cytochrome c oxidase subunit 2